MGTVKGTRVSAAGVPCQQNMRLRKSREGGASAKGLLYPFRNGAGCCNAGIIAKTLSYTLLYYTKE